MRLSRKKSPFGDTSRKYKKKIHHNLDKHRLGKIDNYIDDVIFKVCCNNVKDNIGWFEDHVFYGKKFDSVSKWKKYRRRQDRACVKEDTKHTLNDII